MAKHTTKEAYYERLKNLASVNKTSVKESTIRNLGSLIDYKRASDGIAYGIIKENHHYYIKKAGTKQDPNVSDFAYIGGMSNITDFQFKSLAEADKQRNMIFHDINEANTLKPNKTKSKMILTEDVAKKEIDQAASKVPELDAATSAEKSAPEGSAEMAAGIDAMPAGPADASDTADPSATPTPDAPEASAETGDSPEGKTPALPADKGGDNAEGEEEELSDLQKKVSDIAQEIQTTDLDGGILSWLLDRFIRGFVPAEGEEGEGGGQSKMAEIDDSKRHELADMILNVVPPEEVEKVADSVPQEKPGEADLGPSGLPEGQCAECGSFAQYAESRGYNAESLMECGEEEVGNLVSGYANAHNDGQNDGDIDNVAMIIKIINPEMLNSLKSDYGHEDYANKLEPIVNGMNECSQEEGVVKINELFGGLGNAFKKVGGDIKAGAQKAGQAVGGAIQKGAQAVGNVAQAGANAVGQYATGVKQAYNAGEVPGEVKKLQGIATNLGQQIQALNTRLTKAGQQPIDVKNILKAVTQQVTGKGAGVAGLNPAVAEGIDPAGVEVQPVGQAIEEIKIPEKKGKPLSTKAPVKIMKEEDEPEGEEIEKDEVDFDDIKDGGEEEKPFEKSGDKPLTGFAPAAQSLGGGVLKPESAPMTTVDVNITPDKAVSIQMSESEIKLRKYIRERLEVKAGLRKASLNESKKSPTLKKLDAVIDNQFKLFEGVVLKKKVNEGSVNEIFGWSLKEKFAELDPNDDVKVNELFQEAFKNILINPMMSAIGTTAKRATTQEKYALLQQFVNGGGGSLRVDQNTGKLAYITRQQQNQGLKSSGLNNNNYGAVTK